MAWTIDVQRSAGQVLVGLVLLLSGFAVFVFGSTYFSVWPTNGSTLYYGVLLAVFGAGALLLRRSRNQRIRDSWRAAYALMAATAATLLLDTGVLNLPRSASLTPVADLAVDKLSQFLHIVPLLLVLMVLGGVRMREIFLDTGRLRSALLFGGVAFALFTGVALLTQPDLGAMIGRVPAALPWILLFVLSNAIMEELWFRGIFLRPLTSLIGRWGAILVTSLVFGAAHYFAEWVFPGGPLVLAVVTFVLGFVGAWAMLHHRSLIGAVLLHAGYDMIIIMSVLSGS